MWKYVTRRIRDTVEKTYNVIDVRLTWPITNGTGSTDGQCSVKQQPCLKVYPIRRHCAPPQTDDHKTFRSSNNEKDNEEKDHPFNFQKTIWEAIFWSNALLFTWQFARFSSTHKRYVKDVNPNGRCTFHRQSAPHKHFFFEKKSKGNCPFHREVKNKTQSLADIILDRFVLAAPENFIQSKAPVLVDPRDGYHSNDFLSLYGATKVNNDRNHSPVGQISTSVQTGGSNVDDAIQHLLITVGSIEFMLGVQNMAANNLNDAVSHFKLATTHRHPGATFNLGVCYELGMGVRKNMEKAMKCYRSAAAMGHSKAMYNLGVFYARGFGGLKKNRKAANECFVAAATSGSSEAKLALNMVKKEQLNIDHNPMKKRSDSLNDEGYKSDPNCFKQIKINEQLTGLDKEFLTSVTMA